MTDRVLYVSVCPVCLCACVCVFDLAYMPTGARVCDLSCVSLFDLLYNTHACMRVYHLMCVSMCVRAYVFTCVYVCNVCIKDPSKK